jgi:hypothetical protein
MENGNRGSRAGGTAMVVTFEAGDYFSKALLVTDTFGYVWSFSLGQRCIVTTVVSEFSFPTENTSGLSPTLIINQSCSELK